MIHPASDCLVRNCNSALREQILDITEAEGEPEIEPDRLVNDLRWEAIPGVADFRHALRLPSRRRRDNAAASHLPPPSDEWTMRLIFLVPLAVALCISTFGIGLYAGVKWTWPVPELKGLVAKLTNQATGKDQFGRLLSYPGKTGIACPSQDQMTAVLLVIGQSNAANYQGQRHQSGDDRVINFSAGHCYRAASPLLGADGELGETWTLLGTKLISARVVARALRHGLLTDRAHGARSTTQT